MTFEEAEQLPLASGNDIQVDDISDVTSLGMLARSRPNSVAAYKRLGYKHISYSHWTGTKKAMSTKSKRVAVSLAADLISGLGSAAVRSTVTALSLAASTITQHADVWPTTNARMISATSPRGTRVLIGEELIVKHYTNSSRTHLLKAIHHTTFVG